MHAIFQAIWSDEELFSVAVHAFKKMFLLLNLWGANFFLGADIPEEYNCVIVHCNSLYLLYPSCLQATVPRWESQPSAHTVLHEPLLNTCSTELLPLTRTERETERFAHGDKIDVNVDCISFSLWNHLEYGSPETCTETMNWVDSDYMLIFKIKKRRIGSTHHS